MEKKQKKRKKYMGDEDFVELVGALHEVLDDVRGKSPVGGRVTYVIAPPKKLTAKDIMMIRKRMNIPQSFFATLLNVSVKAVQAWEQGVRTPNGAALRLLTIAHDNPEFFYSQTIPKAA